MITLPEIPEFSPNDDDGLTVDCRDFLRLNPGDLLTAVVCTAEGGPGPFNVTGGVNTTAKVLASGATCEPGQAALCGISGAPPPLASGEYSVIFRIDTAQNRHKEFRSRFYVQ